MRIAFTGKMCSGKDTAADYLVKKGFKKISFAAPIRELAVKVYGTEQTNERRRFMQEIGQAGRKINPNVWIKPIENLVKQFPEASFVINDVRFPNELTALRNLGFAIYRITAPAWLRIRRHVERNGYAPTPEALNDISETALDEYDLPEIDGALPKPEFYKAIDRILEGDIS
jgi:dephospho-CoA kinase